jgi:aminoglycoside 6'-N-acetyltransferase I
LELEGLQALQDDPPLIVMASERAGELTGFIEVSLRSYPEGCSSSLVPYVEGWYVAPTLRGQGVGAALMQAAEAWARDGGFAEMGSDAESVNMGSRAAHAALGFEEVEQLVVFRKDL